MVLSDIRRDFGNFSMDADSLPENPVDLFQSWLRQAAGLNINEMNAMVLSTVGKLGRPSSRIVLLKDVTDEGEFVFFTSYDSRKGEEISLHPIVALNFFWKELEQQVRIEGSISKTSRKISEQYFDSRPAESRISAIVSPQSKVIESMDALHQKAKTLTDNGDELEVPENWGGYAVKPDYFEFWQGGKNRLHDRICYRLEKATWTRERLAP